MLFLVRKARLGGRGSTALPVDRLQSLVATGQYLAAYREVERLAMDPNLDASLKARVFIAGVRAAAGLCDVYAAVKMAERAVECAELGSNWEDIGNARLHSALIYREVGDTAQALRFFALFFQYLDRYPTLQAKTAYAYYNRALTHQQRREYAEALQSYKLSIEDFDRLGDRTRVLACLQNSAWVCLLQGRPAEAEPFLVEARTLGAQIEVPEYQVTQLVVEALFARQTGNPDRAVALCEEIFQEGRTGVQDRHRAEAAWILADLTLGAERLHEAGVFANWALTHALQAKDPHLMNLASDVRQRVLLKQNELRS